MEPAIEDQTGSRLEKATNNQGALNDHSTSEIIAWYRGKNILITGATGFIGKVCLEKIVRQFEECGQIYVLIRSKRGQSAAQRVDKMLNEEPFKVNKINPKLFNKIQAIEGDMSQEGLGLTEDTRRTLIEKVNVVFNIAASVQFDAPLKQNLRDNYIGSNNLLELASQFLYLHAYVHVSTFFVNHHRKHQEEKVLPMMRDCEKMAELIKWIPDQLCDTIAPHIMEERPNTYIFTKAMSENLVQKYQGKFPIAIVRPSIVVPAHKEPMPAWVDNVNGPMGLGVLASLGLLRTIDWNYYGVADFVPVDTVVNSMLVTARRANLIHPNTIKVYNASSSSLNPLTWGNCFECLREVSLKAPPYKMLRIPISVPRYKRANKIQFTMTKLFSELLFAYFVDFILMLCGQKQILTKLTAKLHHGYEILRPFTTNEYTCSNENFVAAYEELSDEDRKLFFFDIRSMNWSELFESYYMGARRLILKESPDNIPKALFKMKVLYVMEAIMKLACFSLLIWSLYKCSTLFSPIYTSGASGSLADNDTSGNYAAAGIKYNLVPATTVN